MPPARLDDVRQTLREHAASNSITLGPRAEHYAVLYNARRHEDETIVSSIVMLIFLNRLGLA